MCSRCAADWFLPFVAGAQDERSSLQNFNLALLHGGKGVFVALGRDAGAAGGADADRNLRPCALEHHGVGDDADVRTQADKLHRFQLR